MAAQDDIRFAADGFVLRRVWSLFLVPLALAALGIALLLQPNFLGIFFTIPAAIVLVALLQQDRRRREPSPLIVTGRALYARHLRLVDLADVVGLSETSTGDGPSLTVLDRRGTSTAIAFESTERVAELRAALGLALTHSASTSFRAHGSLGPLSALFVSPA